MAGSGAFIRIPAKWQYGQLKVRLVGIEHTYNKQIQVLRGTQIGCVLGLIHESFPGWEREQLHF